MQPLEFRIVEGADRATIEKQVNELLRDGWVLYGNLNVVATQSGSTKMGYPVGMFYYAQALTTKAAPSESDAQDVPGAMPIGIPNTSSAFRLGSP